MDDKSIVANSGSGAKGERTAGDSTNPALSADFTPGGFQHGDEAAIDPGARVRYFGDYELIKELGRGGMGIVYKARQISLNRPVALKTIRAARIASIEELRRFQNEAEAVARLDHPNIVPIFEVGQHEDQHYFSMKLVAGESLDKRLKEYASDPRRAARLVAVAAGAIHHAHQRGILHRDLKPANILVDAEEQPHVTDFGLAKRVEGDSSLTQSGAIVGTPAYMAPEQACGTRGVVTTSTDVYGLGAILFNLLTGRAPFGGATVVETLEQVRDRPPNSPRKLNPRVPRDLELICLKCLEKDPRLRYSSADALAGDLKRWSTGEPIKARRVGPVERVWRWCRRNPSWAGLSGSLALSLIALGFAAAFLAGWIGDRRAIGTRVIAGPSASRASTPAVASTPTGRLAIRLSDKETRVEIGGDDDLTTLVGLGTHEISRPMGRYALKVVNGSSTRVEAAEIIPDRRVEVLAGSALEHGPRGTPDEFKPRDGPLLTLHPGGHTAPVRGLCFWAEGSHLLSAGEDKLINDWNLREGLPTIERTIRAPIGPGRAGSIFAMAMTSKPDSQGQSLLAVGGWGVSSARGDMTVFRIPGRGRVPTGEVAARLPAVPAGNPQAIGHSNAVTCLAFAPGGQTLASGSSDQTVVLWDAVTFRPRVKLRGHTGPVQALGFNSDGTLLATAGQDGSVRLWDVNRGAALYVRAGNAEAPDSVNTLAYSPDGQSIVVGLEGGGLFRFDVANLAQVTVATLPTRPDQGPVQAAAFATDGQKLAVSIKSDRVDTLDPMALACDLEVRAWPAGNIVQEQRIPGLVRAMAFSPEGEFLAYTGGASQAVYLRDLKRLENPRRELRGPGSTPFDLGFTANSRVVGFTRELHAPANPPERYEGYDLGQRRCVPVRREELRRAIKQYQGWTLAGSIQDYRLELANADGRRRRILLDRGNEQLWWSWTFLPPGPEHSRPTVAIGTAGGIAVFDVETGQRTRVLAGHASPVVSVVPSPDGRWLASGSLDQTIMFYPLAGCDARPGLGASFMRRPDGVWTVSKVKRASVGAEMGLRAGDLIVQAGTGHGRDRVLYNTSEEIAEFVKLVDGLEPYLYTVGIEIRRTLLIPTIGTVVLRDTLATTKRDSHVLTLFLSVDKEWIVWTPHGYYDSSPLADQRYLEWDRLRLSSTWPAEVFPAVTFETQFRRPDIITNLIGSDDPAGYSASLRWAVPRNQPQPHRLKVLAIGLGGMRGQSVPPISFADRDARHLADRLVQTGARFGFGQVTARAMVGAGATTDKIKEAFAALEVEGRARQPRAGDTVVIFLESRLHHGEHGLSLLGSSSVVQPFPADTLSATEIGNYWKRLVERGYQVLAFLDLRHAGDPESLEGPLMEWVRDLFRSGVLIWLASRDTPGLRNDRSSHGAFAEGLLETLAEAVDPGSVPRSRPCLTLDLFSRSLQAKVLVLTAGAQQPSSYSLDQQARTPVFDPITLERRSEKAPPTGQ
jgi:WD40 repeat protein/tRNA A-37 threonylcarbamoyl transferase component Bud32